MSDPIPIGKKDITNAEVVEEINKEFDFNLYPNPAEDKLTLTMNSGLEQSIELKLTDINGKTLIQTKLEENRNRHILNTSSLNSGVYFVTLKGDDQTAVTRKLIIK